MTSPSYRHFLNSPFCVTLLGGMLVALVTGLWQSRAARIAYRRAVLEHQLTERRLTAKDFANEFGPGLYFFNKVLRRRIWIHDHAKETTHIYPDGRDLASERAYFETLENKAFSKGTPESLAARVAMTFSTPRVQVSVHSLAESLKRMVTDPDEDSLQKDFDGANAYADVIADMQREISLFDQRWEDAT